jgi:hypothetical protein
MEAGVIKLEEFAHETRDRLTRIEVKLDALPSLFSTKEDLAGLRAEMHKAMNEQTWKIIGAFALLASVTFWIAKNVS